MRSLRRLVLVLTASLAPFATSLPAQPVTLAPIADATTDSNQPTVNFGSAQSLDFGKQFVSSPTFMVWFARGHVQFDLSPFIGSGLVPTRATFFWYESMSNAAGCLDVSLHRVTAPWSEGTITWQNQPSFDPTEVSRTCVGDSFALGWKEFDLTSLAQAWFDGSAPNFGFVIRDPQEITAGAARPGLGYSREWPTVAQQPYLEIDFAESFGAGCSTHATVPVLDVAGGAAIMGQTLDLRVSNLLPGSLALVFFGLDNTQWNGTPLPVSLAAIGWPNCDLNVEPGTGLVIGIAPNPTALLPIVVPTSAAFDGLPLYAQAFALTPATALEVSNGLGFRVWL